MLKKCFILTQFGSPHEWTHEYFNNVAKLEKYGWYWQIYTSNKYNNVPSNVEIIPMTTDQFNDLVEKKLNVRPQMFVTPKGVPSVHVTDFCVAWGKIFEDNLKEFDYWGIPNWDEVYGRLDHFLPDEELDKYDVWTDDVNVINGIFCLFRNRADVNVLFTRISNWKEKLAQAPCPRCMGDTNSNHILYGTDEYDLTEVMKDPEVLSYIKYGYPKHYPLHGYDRLETQIPHIKLEIKDDGSLWELQEDIGVPQWIHAHKYIGREIPYYHFIKSKRWPL